MILRKNYIVIFLVILGHVFAIHTMEKLSTSAIEKQIVSTVKRGLEEKLETTQHSAGGLLMKLPQEKGSPIKIVRGADRSKVVRLKNDSTLQLFDLLTLSLIKTFESTKRISDIAIDKVGSIVIISYNDGTESILELSTGNIFKKPIGRPEKRIKK